MERKRFCTSTSVEKEAPPSKDMEMEQHDEEQHAEQPVELLAIGSEIAYKYGETGPNINVLIAQQEFRATGVHFEYPLLLATRHATFSHGFCCVRVNADVRYCGATWHN
ncbi:hypothetical protein B5X24_HaOG212996 [Helicoverpa armigera]|nr:hypothetical protein B5X24_HaOG212996 [Helicoverpa armigera]